MLRARLFWRWCRVHPKTSSIGAAVFSLFVLASTNSDPGQTTTSTAAGSSTTATPPTVEPASAADTPTTPATTSAPPSPSPTRLSVAPVDRTQRGQTTALALLATVSITGRAAKSGYTRDRFGSAWTDDNNAPSGRNGCDTRNDILRRDLTSIVLKPNSNGCSVLTGVLHDPYTTRTITFARGKATSRAVQIDHVVALSNAWQAGASRWTEQTRTDLANDPINLLAVDGATNQSKGDGDAATWLPPNKAYRCAYVARQVAIKARYRLRATQAEHDAIARVLSTCPDQAAPTESSAAIIQLTPRQKTPAQRRTPRPAPTPATTTRSDVYYENCTAVEAAGAAPIYRGDPGYSSKLDRDGDGVACEQ